MGKITGHSANIEGKQRGAADYALTYTDSGDLNYRGSEKERQGNKVPAEPHPKSANRPRLGNNTSPNQEPYRPRPSSGSATSSGGTQISNPRNNSTAGSTLNRTPTAPPNYCYSESVSSTSSTLGSNYGQRSDVGSTWDGDSSQRVKSSVRDPSPPSLGSGLGLSTTRTCRHGLSADKRYVGTESSRNLLMLGIAARDAIKNSTVGGKPDEM